jgi:hypothetical protein
MNNKTKNSERQAAHNETVKIAEEKEATGAVWEQVARMVEANPGGGTSGGIGPGKSTKTAGQSSALGKDTSRMKQLILLYARGEQQTGEKSPSPDIP